MNADISNRYPDSHMHLTCAVGIEGKPLFCRFICVYPRSSAAYKLIQLKP